MVLDPLVDEVSALLPARAEALLERALDHAAQPEDLRLGDDLDDARALAVPAGLALHRALVAKLLGEDVGFDDELGDDLSGTDPGKMVGVFSRARDHRSGYLLVEFDEYGP